MPGLYDHEQRRAGDILTANAYNGDHVNHIDNHIPQMMDDHSPDILAMQVTTDPGGVGSEVLATSLAGEIERFRHQLAEIIGSVWYDTVPRNISTSGLAIDDDDNLSGYGHKIAFKTDDFTLSASDQGKILDCEKDTDLTITVPANSSVALPVGYIATLVPSGDGRIVIDAESGVTIQPFSIIYSEGKWRSIRLHKRATDEWVIAGGVA